MNETIESILNKYNILITCFYTSANQYRFYWVDLNNRFLHNPMIDTRKGGKMYPLYKSFDEGMLEMISSIEKYQTK